MSDHNIYRDGHGGWAPFQAEGWLVSGGAAHSLSTDAGRPRKQPIGFRGAAPGQSLDDRGLPRVRVKAGSTRV